MIRPILSLERLSFDEKDKKVCYRYRNGADELEQMDYTGIQVGRPRGTLLRCSDIPLPFLIPSGEITFIFFWVAWEP